MAAYLVVGFIVFEPRLDARCQKFDLLCHFCGAQAGALMPLRDLGPPAPGAELQLTEDFMSKLGVCDRRNGLVFVKEMGLGIEVPQTCNVRICI